MCECYWLFSKSPHYLAKVLINWTKSAYLTKIAGIIIMMIYLKEILNVILIKHVYYIHLDTFIGIQIRRPNNGSMLVQHDEI